jgi:hypothetical protein
MDDPDESLDVATPKTKTYVYGIPATTAWSKVSKQLTPQSPIN